jgi:uncharacterized membrane protein YgcG
MLKLMLIIVILSIVIVIVIIIIIIIITIIIIIIIIITITITPPTSRSALVYSSEAARSSLSSFRICRGYTQSDVWRRPGLISVFSGDYRPLSGPVGDYGGAGSFSDRMILDPREAHDP